MFIASSYKNLYVIVLLHWSVLAASVVQAAYISEPNIGVCDPNPCHNDGNCEVCYHNAYRCKCKPGFKGSHCETDIDECSSAELNNCYKGPGGWCQNTPGGYICGCDDGYEGNGLFCVVENICGSNPCQNYGTCMDKLKSYFCYCQAGFTGTNCEIDIDECSDPLQNICYKQAGGWCKNTHGGYTCGCDVGYEGDGITCTPKFDIYEPKNSCDSNPCQNNGRCHGNENSYRCYCEETYFGRHCEHHVGEWSSWSPCTGECGHGLKSRERSCTNDSPSSWTLGGCMANKGDVERQVEECTIASCTGHLHTSTTTQYPSSIPIETKSVTTTEAQIELKKVTTRIPIETKRVTTTKSPIERNRVTTKIPEITIILDIKNDDEKENIQYTEEDMQEVPDVPQDIDVEVDEYYDYQEASPRIPEPSQEINTRSNIHVVKPSQRCPPGKTWIASVQSCPSRCSSAGRISCSVDDSHSSVGSCVCPIDKPILTDRGECVPSLRDCPKAELQKRCPENQKFLFCGSNCPKFCSDPYVAEEEICTEKCVEGCGCPKNKPWMADNGRCVKKCSSKFLFL